MAVVVHAAPFVALRKVGVHCESWQKLLDLCKNSSPLRSRENDAAAVLLLLDVAAVVVGVDNIAYTYWSRESK